MPLDYRTPKNVLDWTSVLFCPVDADLLKRDIGPIDRKLFQRPVATIPIVGRL